MQTFKIPAGATEVIIPDIVPGFTIPDPEPNEPPTANAGTDIDITLPINTVLLNGVAKDSDGTINSVKWTQTRGTGAVIEDPTLQSTRVSNIQEGINEFTFEVSDNGGLKRADSLVVTVKPKPTEEPTQQIYGFGARAKGGEGKTVINVTPATFKKNIGSNRILKFTQGGTITGGITLRNVSYLTIDANGFNVVIQNASGDGLSIASGSHHIIEKGISVINSGNDNFNVIEGAYEVAFIGCYSDNSTDGGMDIADGYNITIQECVIANCKKNGGSLCTGKEVSYFRNLFYGNKERNPMVHSNYTPVGSPNADIRNNLIANWSGYGIGVGYRAKANAVNNFLQSNSNPGNTIDNRGGWGSEPVGYIYSSGNVSGNNQNPNSDSNISEISIPDWATLPIEDARTAANRILQLKFSNPDAQKILESVVLK